MIPLTNIIAFAVRVVLKADRASGRVKVRNLKFRVDGNDFVVKSHDCELGRTNEGSGEVSVRGTDEGGCSALICISV